MHFQASTLQKGHNKKVPHYNIDLRLSCGHPIQPELTHLTTTGN